MEYVGPLDVTDLAKRIHRSLKQHDHSTIVEELASEAELVHQYFVRVDKEQREQDEIDRQVEEMLAADRQAEEGLRALDEWERLAEPDVPQDHPAYRSAPGIEKPPSPDSAAPLAVNERSEAGELEEDELEKKANAILNSLLKLEATAEEKAVTIEEAAGQAALKMKPGSYKHTVAQLVKDKLVQSKPGRTGGIWLTTVGQEKASLRQ
jgi:hypothetical protein